MRCLFVAGFPRQPGNRIAITPVISSGDVAPAAGRAGRGNSAAVIRRGGGFVFRTAPFFLFLTGEILSNGSMFNLTRRFPLLVALVAFVLYLATVSHGVTMNSLSLTAKLAGWDGTPLVGQPLLWLLTLPLRRLPAGGIALALNLFSAATAALTLGLLARTVQLLPWDQPWTK